MEARLASTRRILDAARALIARGGAAEVSLGDVAVAAGVSKALVSYHFRDKDSLLVAVVDAAGYDVVAREEAVVTGLRALDAPSTGGRTLDAFWEWLRAELEHGDLRVLSSLAAYDSAAVRSAARRIAQQRRHVCTAHVRLVFERLGLRPRVAPTLIADTIIAFADGLAVAAALNGDRDARPAFDVLCLALLSLAD